MELTALNLLYKGKYAMKKSVSIVKFLRKERHNERISTERIYFLCFP